LVLSSGVAGSFGEAAAFVVVRHVLSQACDEGGADTPLVDIAQ
jgi:hypothetical protein